MSIFRFSPRSHDILETVPAEVRPPWETAAQLQEQRDQRLEAWLARTATDGPWVSFTTTVTGWAIGNGTQDCAYHKSGTKVTCRMHIVAGTTTTFAAALNVTPPFPIASEMWGMFGMANDSSAVVFAPIMVRAQAASTVTFYPLAAVAQMDNAGLTTTHPFTWATSDRVHATFTYESTL